jgi:23S rRNA (uracil1939-C5)-methyltransferase
LTEKAAWIRSRFEERLSLSSVVMPCEVQSICGGCPLMPLSTAQQHAAKRDRVSRSLAAQGVVLPDAPLEIVAAPRAFAYRNRIRLRLSPEGRIGFFNQNKVESCAVLEEGLRDRLRALWTFSEARPELFSGFQHLELRSDDVHGRPGLALCGAHSANELLESNGWRDARARAERLGEVLQGFVVGVRGDPEIAWQERRIVGDITGLVPLDGFIQVNSAVNARLVAALRDGALRRNARTVLDLYAGSGNFSLPLAVAGAEVCAVEIHAPSVRALAAASHARDVSIACFAKPAAVACPELVASRRRYELVIVDAPRAGARDALHALLPLAAQTIAICSCNAESLARDTAELVRAGFHLEELTLFDMFPQTEHVEALAWLERDSAADRSVPDMVYESA